MPAALRAYRHIGIYAYRVDFLNRFVGWPVGALEALESLEQLRALEHGVGIHVAQACAPIPGGVDTPADLARVDALLRGGG
jgi:3-deoxy-manno-octulosonate cytidylyltransferase (CMP-KDO synthetase)